MMADGHPVTFWHAVTGGDPEPTHIDLARLLAAYHAAPDCPCELDVFEPFRVSESRLDKAAASAPQTWSSSGSGSLN